MRVRRLVNRGNALLQRDLYQEAVLPLQEARSLAHGAGLRDEELQSSLSLSACFWSLGNIDATSEILQRAIEIADELGDLRAKAKCLLNLGGLVHDSDPQEGLARFEDAAKAFEKAGDTLGMAQALDNIGMIYNGLGLYRSAVHYIDRARRLFVESGDLLELGKCYRAIGNLLSDMATEGLEKTEFARPLARENYEQSIKIFQQLGAAAQLGHSLDVLGLLARDEGSLDEAVELHSRAIAILERCRALPRLSSALLHLANAHYVRKDFSEALEILPNLRRLKQQLGDEQGFARAGHIEALVRLEVGQYAETIRLLRASIAHQEKMIHRLVDEELRTQATGTSQKSWSVYLYALARKALTDSDSNESRLLIPELERSKSQLLGHQLANPSAPWPEDETTLQQLREEIEHRTVISLAGARRAQLRRELEAGDLSQQEFEQAIARVVTQGRKAFFRLREIRTAPVSKIAKPSWADILQKQDPLGDLTDLTTLYILDFLFRKEIGFAMLYRGELILLEIVSLDSEGEATLREWLTHLGSGAYSKSWRRWERTIRRISIFLGELLKTAGVLSHLPPRGASLLLIPHGSLHQLPWEAAGTKGESLGLEYSVTRSFSAHLAALAQAQRCQERPPPATRRAVVTCPTPDGLPASAKEAREVGALLKQQGFEAETLIGVAATRSTFLPALRRNGVEIIHFAGHGLFDRADSSMSALVLEQDAQQPEESRLLTALEIQRRIRLGSSPIVYLNCCESAVAEVRAGDEPYGLVRSFLLSGASHLVLAGWKVLDESAVDMASGFYRAIGQGAHPAEAVRAARKEVHGKAGAKKYDGPMQFAHWGPYLVYGSALPT